MIRARFFANADDYRPVEWPAKHPYWCTGYGGFDNPDSEPAYAIIVAYADDIEEIKRNWPEASNIESEEATQHVFTLRFPKPDWFGEVPQ